MEAKAYDCGSAHAPRIMENVVADQQSLDIVKALEATGSGSGAIKHQKRPIKVECSSWKTRCTVAGVQDPVLSGCDHVNTYGSA